jgi:hypothetical protein
MSSYGISKEEWMDYAGTLDEAGVAEIMDVMKGIQ